MELLTAQLLKDEVNILIEYYETTISNQKAYYHHLMEEFKGRNLLMKKICLNIPKKLNLP